MNLRVEFAGEVVHVVGDTFSIGREADLVVDSNPFLHRRFLLLTRQPGWWALTNVGERLTATVCDVEGRLEAFLAPGAMLPIVLERLIVRFAAGPTSYELTIEAADPPFVATPRIHDDGGATTVGRVRLTTDQLLLVLALAEPALRGMGRSGAALPSSGEAARRLGWTSTKFTRKLDNVCQKLTSAGVRGLHGEPGRLAANRRARLVEYALAVRLVTGEDLRRLDDLPVDDEGDDDGHPAADELDRAHRGGSDGSGVHQR